MERIKEQHNTLKSKSVGRILSDMIGDTKKIAGGAFLVIIVDDYSAKVLSSFFTMSEILNEGIFSVERLHTKRQPFPKYHALYFISPTGDSCERLAEDFNDDTRPMYNRIHIFFTHQVMDPTMDKVVTDGVAQRLVAIKELNLSFLIRDKNLYDLGFSGAMKIFAAKKEDQAGFLSTIKERLMTVCMVLREFPHVQYQKSSSLCAKLAENINAELKFFYPEKTPNDRKGILLITDRTLDPTTPFLHDYNWETIVYDFYTINGGLITFDGKISKLDESDSLWTSYKNMHMAQVFDKLPKDFEEFMQSDLSKVGKGENLDNFDGMADVLKNMNEYKTKTMQFSLHLKLAEDISTVRLKIM